MGRITHIWLILLLALAGQWSLAQSDTATVADPSFTTYGLTGLVRVPTADVLPDGQFRAQWTLPSDEVSLGIGGSATYAVSLGILPRVEGSLAMGSGDQSYDFTAHGKWQALPQQGMWPAIAVGIADLKRTQPNLDPTAFVVATRHLAQERLSLTLGAAAGENAGLLAGVGYRALPWLEVQGEYDTRRVNVGAAVRLTKGLWLRAADTDLGTLVTAGYQFTLGGESRPFPAPVEVGPSTLISAAAVTAVQQALVALGFENVRVTQTAEILHASYENRRYTLSEADGIAVALPVLAQNAPANVRTLQLTITRRDVPIALVAVPADAYRAFARGEMRDEEFATRLAVRLLPDAEPAPDTQTATANRSYGHADLMFGPGVSTMIGTDIGAFKYGLTVQPQLTVPIAPGLLADARWSFPLAGELVENEPDALTNDRAVLAYLARPARGVLAQALAGRFPGEEEGVAVEAAMPLGRRSLLHGVTAGLNNDLDETHAYLLGEYWYTLPALDAQARLFAGRFLDEDNGWGVDFLRFFGDVQVGVGYRDTNTSNVVEARLVLPLSPRKQPFRPGALRVRTPDYLDYRLRSVLGERNPLFLTERTANELSLGPGLVETILDRNRLLPDYLVERLGRNIATSN